MVLAICCITSCTKSAENMKMDEAETLIETHPDSSFSLLKTIDKNSLRSKADKARYALLMSMALDKNYIDTTTFDVLQPAIDYYLKKGTPDQKLRTYYYQGRIFQNQGDRDKAMNAFIRALDVAPESTDSLVWARTLVAEAHTYFELYDINNWISHNLKAANIYKLKNKYQLEFDCLIRAADGCILTKQNLRTDSILGIISKEFESLSESDYKRLQNIKLKYATLLGNKQNINEIIENNSNKLISDTNSLLNLADAYRELGDLKKATEMLSYVDNCGIAYDSLKYQAIAVYVLRAKGDYENALSTYWEFSNKVGANNVLKFNQKVQSIDEKHRIELEAQKEAQHKSHIIWICVSGIVFLILGIVILLLLIRSHKHQKYIALQQAKTQELENEKLKSEKELAIQRARTSELENDKLKSEKELAIQRARTSELENDKLKSEKELAIQQSRIKDLENEKLKSDKERLALDNRNLQLERDKKALEMENLSHRVEQLEDESETLKNLIEDKKDLPEEVRATLRIRMQMLNALLAGYITDNDQLEKPYDKWVRELTENTDSFMNSNRLAFQASHPKFIKYFEDHGLTNSEINYVCLYAIGLKGKEVGNYIKKRSHVNTSSAIRKKLGIDKYETNIGIYVRRLLDRLL